jgi:Glycosyl transferase family 2
MIGRLRAIRADIRATRARAEQLTETSAHLTAWLQACHAELSSMRARLEQLDARTAGEHQRLIQALRIIRDDDSSARERLWNLRASDEYALAFDEDEPLVTIIITTYNNWPLMRERSLPSVLAQTYERWECIIIGDAAPPEAAAAVASFGDGRLRYVNLPYRGPYPPDLSDAWLVSGTTPFNTGLALAAGRWTGAVSDDDSLSPRYIESLLRLARAERAEVAYGLIHQREPDSDGRLLGTFPPQVAQWGIQGSLVHGGLRYLPLEPTDWLFGVPNDWSLADRMLRIGVRFAMLGEVVVDYYPGTLWKTRPDLDVSDTGGSP